MISAFIEYPLLERTSSMTISEQISGFPMFSASYLARSTTKSIQVSAFLFCPIFLVSSGRIWSSCLRFVKVSWSNSKSTLYLSFQLPNSSICWHSWDSSFDSFFLWILIFWSSLRANCLLRKSPFSPWAISIPPYFVISWYFAAPGCYISRSRSQSPTLTFQPRFVHTVSSSFRLWSNENRISNFWLDWSFVHWNISKLI